MRIVFYVRYHTSFGQSLLISGNLDALGNDEAGKAMPLNYVDDQFWSASIEVEAEALPDEVNYRYLLRDPDGFEITEGERERSFNFPEGKFKEVTMVDTWNHAGLSENALYTQPFQQVLAAHKHRKSNQKFIKLFTHEFRVKIPLLGPDELVCITGSANALKNWDIAKPHLLDKNGNWYSTRINFKNEYYVKYKYGIYNATTKQVRILEEGEPRQLFGHSEKKNLFILHDGFGRFLDTRWRGAGIAIPVFSLRTENGFGCGEFSDLMLLADWAAESGLKMIQILPVNDTTSTHSWMDSYPYSAISATALNPVYINLEKAAGKHISIINALKKKKKSLNELTEFDYEQVSRFKLSAMREIFNAAKEDFGKNTEFFAFFDLNRHWLVPYAAFSYLRDKNGTAEFAKWKSHKKYREDAIQRLVAPSQPQYGEICFHYFMQFYLYLQLKEASAYAHKKGIILKGDIPIGISLNSCDAWMEPELYNMNEQSGAPPDDFAVKGQNWGFPTYNWSKMKEDGFSWWRHRFEVMSQYFDAFRIDHILGFFRIWSIPLDAVEGVLGRFIPAIPVFPDEFKMKGIAFNHDRYCKPYITIAVLQQYPEHAEKLILTYLIKTGNDEYSIKAEFNTQRKVEANCPEDLKSVLFDLISNIILIPGKENEYHFRIAMEKTSSFLHLDADTQGKLKELYVNYFYCRQDHFWKMEGLQKLPELTRSTNMLICGEDLGMVPACVPEVMKDLCILSLEIQRMPKNSGSEFFHPKHAPYLSVVTPSTHDMSTLREWWEEDRSRTNRFYNKMMGHYGMAPAVCEPWISREIIIQHLYSPAMWSVFQLQDILGLSDTLRRDDPKEERINQPADPKHYWRYRMHLTLETLINEKEFNTGLKEMVAASGRI